ncbi:MAG: DUF362 domain-containing protein [Candidatus Lokiarchaeota archaeon]|nr:DUF362 domain-containing protein [Candidatus Lokiarchaeota archaeon]
MDKPIVSLARNENIELAVIQALDQLKLPNFNNKTILLKPNVGRETDPKLGINTNPDVVLAVFNYLNKKFKATFLLGDSPIINTDTKKAFLQSGYSKIIENDKVQFIDLDRLPPITLKIPKGKIIKEIKVTGYWNEIDCIISIPVLKMHMHCGASLSFKNLKGLIYKRDKIKLHHLQSPEIIEELKPTISKIKELDVAISDLSYIFKPELVIIDASYALEGMGPSSGNAVKMDTIIASTNFLAADIIAIALTREDWSLIDVPHLKLISELEKENPKSFHDIITIPNNIQIFKRNLEPPPTTITIKYSNVNLISEQACSACLSTVTNLLQNNIEFINKHYTSENPLRIAIGKGLNESNLYQDTLLIGNCTFNFKDKGIFIKGCTPVESTIIEVIKKSLDNRIKL